jgi:DNA-binding LytR/AlgR family response regulator
MNGSVSKLTVKFDSKDNSRFKTIEFADVNFMESDKAGNSVIVHTTSGNYQAVGSLAYWTSFLSNTKDDFIRADRNVLINVSNIKGLDVNYKRAYFGEDIDENCLISEKGYSKIKEKIKTKMYEVRIYESPIGNFQYC